MNFEKITFTCLIFAFVVSYTVAEGGESDKNATLKNDEPVTTKTENLTTPTPFPAAAQNVTNGTTTVTSPTPTSSSTEPPKTTVKPDVTTVAPTSSPAPTPDEKWIVQKNNTVCVIMKSNIVIHASYGNKTEKQEKVDIIVPKNVIVSGSCDGNASSQSLTLSWSSLGNKTNSVNFTFNMDKDKKEYYTEKVDVVINVNATKDNSTEVKTINLSFIGKEFLGHEGFSFTCASPSPLKLNGTTEVSGSLALTSLQYEAFGTKNNTNFASAEDCDSHETPDIVPILVAAALILLVALVLIFYVIERRRSASRGYLSM